jgi:hypothetical protein
MGAGPGLVLAAGTITFGNEWIQTGKLNFRVPVATIFASLLFTGIDKVSANATTGLGVLVLTASLMTPLGGGKSPLQELQSISKE